MLSSDFEQAALLCISLLSVKSNVSYFMHHEIQELPKYGIIIDITSGRIARLVESFVRPSDLACISELKHEVVTGIAPNLRSDRRSQQQAKDRQR